jgi:hypothetical protein
MVDETSLCSAARHDILEYICGENSYPINAADIIENTFPIIFAGEKINIQPDGWTEQCDITDKCSTISALLHGMDALRGFYLDRYVNRIGTTGWDCVRQCVCGTDPFRAALNRSVS